MISYSFLCSQSSEIKTLTIKFSNVGKVSIYQYNDDSSSIYVANLFVLKSYRHKGIGIQLLKISEQIGKSLNADNCYLLVKKDSWMHEWYKRIGYMDFKNYEKQKGFIWMIKSLIK